MPETRMLRVIRNADFDAEGDDPVLDDAVGLDSFLETQFPKMAGMMFTDEMAEPGEPVAQGQKVLDSHFDAYTRAREALENLPDTVDESELAALVEQLNRELGGRLYKYEPKEFYQSFARPVGEG